MANPEHLAILKQGVKVWNAWRETNPKVTPDLGGTDLSKQDLENFNLDGADLWDSILFRANLKQATLWNANLRHANLQLADLREADLSGANLREANLTEASLSKTYLREADLTGSTFSETDIRGADFMKVRLAHTSFEGVDLSDVKELESIDHRSPSFISIDTIYKSKGNIPEVFLRGCGVPENFITFMRSLTGKAFQFYSCFISHSAKDKPFCERLYADLQAKGVRVWYFPEDAQWGEAVWGEIDATIKAYDKLIVVCSENSLQSGPVNREIERALNREDKEGKGILFPIRIDDHIFDKWENARKADILRKVVGDFSGWEKDAAKYGKAFDKLLIGLQAESARA